MAKKYTNQNTYGQYTGNTPLDAYNFYKKNEQAAQEAISSMNFTSAQDSSAQFGQSMMAPFSSANAVAPKANNTILGMNTSLLKGLLVGASVALVATNPKVQKAVVGGAVKAWSAVQASVEEMKEQVEDAKAELAQEDN